MAFQPYWISLVATPIIIRWLQIRAQTARAKHHHNATIFHASGSWVYAASVVLACFIAIGGWRQGVGLTTVSIGVLWCLFSLWLWPSTIILDGNGVTARHIWRPTRTILYSEIDYVSRMANRETIVYGSGKVKEISVSEYHVGADELEAELRKHAAKVYREVAVPLGSGIR